MSCTASSTACFEPRIFTTPSSLATAIVAPESACSCLIVAPPRPMMSGTCRELTGSSLEPADQSGEGLHAKTGPRAGEVGRVRAAARVSCGGWPRVVGRQTGGKDLLHTISALWPQAHSQPYSTSQRHQDFKAQLSA